MASRGPLSGLFLFLGVALWIAPFAAAQGQRPLPHPLVPPPQYELAVEAGTRTADGSPGPAYWQNHAAYQIDAVLSPATKVLRAEGSIRYFNNSPDPLERLYLHLRQNLHASDAIRNRTVEITGGLQLGSVRVGNRSLLDRPGLSEPGYDVSGTILRVELPETLAPGDSVDLHLAWSFTVPGDAPRMGQDGEVFFLGFWYPQMAVYDDVVGWNVDPYMGNGEFYMGFADYDVRITVPEQWLVAATGTLENAEEILTPTVRARLASIAPTDSSVQVVTEAERGSVTTDSNTGTHTWHFTANRVRDFAFGASALYVWDAALARVKGRDPVPVHVLYRPDRDAWDQGAKFTKWSVEWLSERVSPYPFAHMTVVEGLIGGGMEYPMLTLVGGGRTPVTLFRTVFHEVAHIWYPMMLSQNETAFAWMDEGLVSYLSDDALVDYWGDASYRFYDRYYTRVAGTGFEVESARHSDQFPVSGSARTTALYGKPTVALQALRGMVGAEAMDEALRAYTARWAYRHPYPWDFFRAVNEVLGQDLDWFWSALFFETWTLDHALAGVEADESGVRVTVRDEDLLPLGTVVQVTYADGRTERQRIEPAHWLSGRTEARLTFPAGNVERVELDPEHVNPDLDRENDVWLAPGS